MTIAKPTITRDKIHRQHVKWQEQRNEKVGGSPYTSEYYLNYLNYMK